MKKLLAIAGFLLASTLLASTAQAQYTFEYGGRTIHIDPDRGTVSIPGVYDNTGRRKHVRKDQDDGRPRKQAPQQATVDPQAPAPAPAPVSPAPTDQAAVPASPVPASPDTSVPPAASANTETADIPAAAPPPPPAIAPAAPVQQEAVAAPTARPAPPPPPAPAVAAAPVAPPLQKPQAPATTVATAQPPPPSPNSPLGLWLTEEKEGKVRIEQCGANLCGYSVDAKSNQNGEQVLINMKPSKDAKWSGRIFDPNSGSTYDSTIALKSPNSLRVQGCAFGGMFCGGQTWSRVN